MTTVRLRLRRHRGPLLVALWLIVVAIASLAPALAHGPVLGPSDLMEDFGLGAVHPLPVPYNTLSADQIRQMMPWLVLDWRAVHSGHLPLWNPSSALGTPLAFNFQSAPFAVPNLIAYLFPLRLAYTVSIVVRLVIGGTGVWFFTRVLGAGDVPAAFAGTVFELSGAFSGWIGWPQSSTGWMGWLLGATVLVVRGRRRWRSVALFAVVLACAVYGGHPESVLLMAIGVAVVAMVHLAARVRRQPDRRRRSAMAVADLTMATLGGLALSAPLLLPGTQILTTAARNGSIGYEGESVVHLVGLIAGGFFGTPVTGSLAIGNLDYYEAASYVGVIALALAVLAVLTPRRRAATVSMAVLAGLMLAIMFVSPVAHLFGDLPLLETVFWTRASIPLDLALAVLAGLGLETLRTSSLDRRLLVKLGLATGIVLVAVGLAAQQVVPATPLQHYEQFHALIWPLAGVVVLILTVGGLVMARRRTVAGSDETRWPWAPTAAGWLLFGVEVAFLLTVMPTLWSSGSSFFPTTPAEKALEHIVGDQRVGFGVDGCTGSPIYPAYVGVMPDDNDVYGIAEFAVYDPALPTAYYTSWASVTKTVPQPEILGFFCPEITDVALARTYGTRYVIEKATAPAPKGMRPVARLGTAEELYLAPAAGVVTEVPAGASGTDPNAEVLPFREPTPSTLVFHTDDTRASTLYLHVTDVPGWHLSVDGRAASLSKWKGVMMRAELPPGRHVVVLRYLPSTFVLGLWLAAGALAALGASGLIAGTRRRRSGGKRPRPTLDEPRTPTSLPPMPVGVHR